MKTRTWIILFAGVLVAAICSAWFLLPRGKAARAEIWSEGRLLEMVELSEDRQLTLETENGINIICIRDGKIGVIEADCPDGYCMKRGFCDGGSPIVCLPHSLVIRFTGEQSVDGALG